METKPTENLIAGSILAPEAQIPSPPSGLNKAARDIFTNVMEVHPHLRGDGFRDTVTAYCRYRERELRLLRGVESLERKYRRIEDVKLQIEFAKLVKAERSAVAEAGTKAMRWHAKLGMSVDGIKRVTKAGDRQTIEAISHAPQPEKAPEASPRKNGSKIPRTADGKMDWLKVLA